MLLFFFSCDLKEKKNIITFTTQFFLHSYHKLPTNHDPFKILNQSIGRSLLFDPSEASLLVFSLAQKREGNQNYQKAGMQLCDKFVASDYAFVYRRLYARHSVGQQLSTGGRPRKTPLFDYSSTMAKEKPQGRGLARNDFRAPSKGTRSRTGRREARRSEEARKRKRRQERSEIYSRTQTDVNLFKLRDFGSGRGRAGGRRGWWSLLRHDGSGSICFITARDKGWAWSALARARRTLFCGKLKSRPSLFSFARV